VSDAHWDGDFSVFRELEEQLLDYSIRRSPKIVANLLADEFIEFGSSGAVYNKQTMIDALSTEHLDENQPVRSAHDFWVQKLSDSVVHVTYRTLRKFPETGSQHSALRSSIWKFIDGRWQMLFHQGTPTQRTR
jgi:hypothetical protein